MKSFVCAAVIALVASGCGNEQAALPAPKEAVKPALPATAAPVAPVAPSAPLTDVPATSANADAVTAYRTAVDYIENSREAEAREQLKKAVSLDPSFVSAKVALGAMTPGSAGDAMIAEALGKAAGLPEAELVNARRLQAMHARDAAKTSELAKKLVDLLPASARAQGQYGDSLQTLGKLDAAKAAYKKAIELGPEYASALNQLGYLEITMGEPEAGVAHLQKYAALRPKEANPADSLGEAYLSVGKLEESEASFKKALEIDPTFTVAYTGVAFANLYRGESAKGLEALGKYRDSAGLTQADRSDTHATIAWAQLGLGKNADAMKTLDTWDAETKKANDVEQGIVASITRAHLTIESGKPEDALKQIPAVLERVGKASVSDGRKARWQIRLRSEESVAYARLKKAPEADKARLAVDALAASADDSEVKTLAATTRGEALLAKGDAAGAVKELAACSPGADYCAWERMKAQEKAGLKTEAAATRDALVKNRHRNGMSFFVWSKVAPPAAPAKK
ncbi:MAG TPA: tetratricopeptide repeat protein [Labilithrix sp.]|nr:tetratricopeptide repeat protein [Labilithrix sp.]